jgi:hypothetical protein
MVAQVCDLLDAAAALAGTPLLALVMVRELSGEINRKAWTGEDTKPGRREAIINRSLSHRFTSDDFRAISEALERLDGKSNRAAWKFVRETIPLCQMYRNLEIARLSYLQRKYVFVSPLLVHVRRPADASILTSELHFLPGFAHSAATRQPEPSLAIVTNLQVTSSISA